MLKINHGIESNFVNDDFLRATFDEIWLEFIVIVDEMKASRFVIPEDDATPTNLVTEESTGVFWIEGSSHAIDLSVCLQISSRQKPFKDGTWMKRFATSI